jgi:hypothetical protein
MEDTDGVVAHSTRHRGEVGRVGTRTTAGAARGAVRKHLTCARGHQGSRASTMGRSEGTARKAMSLCGRWSRAVGGCQDRTSYPASVYPDPKTPDFNI